MEILSENNPLFSDHLNQLLDQAGVLPIYATAHKNYYKIIFNNPPQKNFNIVVTNLGKALGAFLINEFADEGERGNLSYFGLPGLFVISPEITDQEKNEVAKKIIDHLVSRDFKNLCKKLNFDIIFPFHSMNEISATEKIVKLGNNHYINYERVINLSADEASIYKNYSKSVKDCIHKTNLQDVEFKVFDSYASKSEQEFAIFKLKQLHLASAGKITRSSESWDEQLALLRNGSVLITHGILKGEVVHSSLFLQNLGSVYYGVSANQISSQEISISHYFLHKTIIELRRRKYLQLYMGRQYENLERKINKKEEGIAQFKSFYGGTIKPFIGISKNEK